MRPFSDMSMKIQFLIDGGRILPSLLLCLFAFDGRSADAVFSGPQKGEKTAPFKVISIVDGKDGVERDPIAENAGASTAIVFVHAIERSLVPLLRVIDEYGATQKERLKTEVVFLTTDRIQGEQRVRDATKSLRLKAKVGLSVDGIEGPGNYGLNKECMMTVVVARENKVSANFALVQPGIADAANVIAAIAAVCGDEHPPTSEALLDQARGGAGGRMAGAGRPMREGGETNRAAKGGPKVEAPGTAPTDPTLTSLLRQFIRPTNDVATVDRLCAEVKKHVQGNVELTKQAADGWTRVLHFGTNYGTEYSRKIGREMLELWGKEKAGKPVQTP